MSIAANPTSAAPATWARCPPLGAAPLGDRRARHLEPVAGPDLGPARDLHLRRMPSAPGSRAVSRLDGLEGRRRQGPAIADAPRMTVRARGALAALALLTAAVTTGCLGPNTHPDTGVETAFSAAVSQWWQVSVSGSPTTGTRR